MSKLSKPVSADEGRLPPGNLSGRRRLDKKSQSLTAVGFLQTDAAVNSGNSDSPVFTTDGSQSGPVWCRRHSCSVGRFVKLSIPTQ